MYVPNNYVISQEIFFAIHFNAFSDYFFLRVLCILLSDRSLFYPRTRRKTLEVSLKVSSTQSTIIVGSPLERNAEKSAYARACVRTDARLCVLNVYEGRIS